MPGGTCHPFSSWLCMINPMDVVGDRINPMDIATLLQNVD
jgi:hypothetical protein